VLEVIPLTTPPPPTEGPVGEKVYEFEPLKLEIVEISAELQVAAVELIVGTAGVAKIGSLLNTADAFDVHVPNVAVTV
jgi:hypothetical protein